MAELLALGQVRHRRRRAAVAGVAAAVIVIAGAGVAVGLAAHGSSTVEPAAPGGDQGTDGTLVYVSSMSYSSSCSAVGAVDRSDADGVTLVLSEGGSDGELCTADAGPVTATITGLEERPTELSVTEATGTATLPVLGTSLSADELTLAIQIAKNAQAQVTGTFVGATAIATYGRVPGQQGCPDSRLVQIRVVWLADANFTHFGVPGVPPDGPRKAQIITVDTGTGETCSRGASYRQVGATPDEILLYGARP